MALRQIRHFTHSISILSLSRSFSALSFHHAMPPRRSGRAQPVVELPSDTQTAALSTSPVLDVKPTLIHALEHIPPAPPRSPAGSDDLTPPPDNDTREAITTRVADKVADELNGDASSLTPEVEEEVETKPSPTPKKRGRKAAPKKDGETPKVTPKKRAKKEESASDGDDYAEGDEGVTPSKKPKKKTPKKSRVADDEPEFDEDGNEIPKKKKRVKVYPKIEYDIPPVERKETTFKGRLGYACLNTVLRGTKPDSIFCSRTCRIASIEEEGMDLPKKLALMNVKDLLKMIQWNEDNKIRFLRLSSEMFPFASHAKYGYSLEYAAAELKEAGDLAKKYGHRLTMHPGQFTQIGSPKEAVVTASFRELEYQCEIMDRMGLDKDGVMIIHMGGVYGDKPTTLARFKENYKRLPERIKARLVLENDEICYNVDDLYLVCDELNIPIIFDYHHDWINPSTEPPAVLIPKINELWARKGIRVKQHLSEPRPGAESVMERRAHADRCKSLPDALPDDVDLMIEAKDKEQAVFELYRIYGLEDVIHDNLRPPDPNPGMHTKGRKSSLKKKVKETGDVDSDGEPVKLDDVEKEGDGGIGDEGSVGAREASPKPKRGSAAKAAKKLKEEEEEDVEEVKPKPKRARGKAAKEENKENEVDGALDGDWMEVDESENEKPKKPQAKKA